MSFQDINFIADVGPIFDEHGTEIPESIGRRVFRTDTDQTLSVVGQHYQPIQYTDLISPALSALKEMGYNDIQERQPNPGNLYDLQGKKGAFFWADTAKNGAVMRAQLILGDFINPTGSTSYLDQGPDHNFFRVSFLSSHDSTYAARTDTDYVRTLCMNGMVQPHFSAGFFGRHTSGFSVDAMMRQIQSAMSMMDEDADRFGLWAKTRISVPVAEMILRQTVAKLPNKANGEPHFSEPLVNKILHQFRREDQTVWGLYNACTWWSSHGDVRGSASRLTTTVNREKAVAGMLRSKAWAEAEAGVLEAV